MGILTVEGAHAFGDYAFPYPFSKPFRDIGVKNQKIITQSVIANIEKVKQQTDKRLIPFFVTFSHHFNNLLAGHATSLSD